MCCGGSSDPAPPPPAPIDHYAEEQARQEAERKATLQKAYEALYGKAAVPATPGTPGTPATPGYWTTPQVQTFGGQWDVPLSTVSSPPTWVPGSPGTPATPGTPAQPGTGGALAQARSEFEAEAIRRGLNPADYQGLIDREISRILGLIPEDSLTPNAYFSGAPEAAFGKEESGLRTRSVARVNELAPTGFEMLRTPDSVVDPILEDIINKQYGTAREGIEGAHRRGTLVDSGFGKAIAGLDEKKSAARAQFDPIVSSVLNAARGEQRNVADTWRARAAGLNLGQNFDENAFTSLLNDTENRVEGGLGGQIRNLAPNLFDIGELIGIGGAAQGAQNTPVRTLTRDQQREQKRGLGSTGAF